MQRSTDEIWLLLDSSGFGGIESHVLQLARALLGTGRPVRVVLLADHGPHPLHDQLALDDIPCEVLGGGLNNLLHALGSRPKLVHTHGYKAGILARTCCRLLHIPVVSTFHAGDTGKGRMVLYDTLDRWLSVLAPAIAVSAGIAERLPGSASIIDNFVTPAPTGSGITDNCIAFVGRLSHEKGPDLLCELAERLPEASIDIYGDGPMRQELEPAAGRNVHFHGAVDDMPARWDKVGLLCMPSRQEGLPMAALEAMARGIPVAAFAVGGLPRLIEHGSNGWLASPGDLDALAEHLQSWLAQDDATRTQTAAAAQATITQHFAPGVILPKILAIYGQAAGRHTPGHADDRGLIT